MRARVAAEADLRKSRRSCEVFISSFVKWLVDQLKFGVQGQHPEQVFDALRGGRGTNDLRSRIFLFFRGPRMCKLRRNLYAAVAA